MKTSKSQISIVLVLLFLALPFALRETAWSEWANPYWFLVEQTNQVKRFGFPSFFIHSDVSGTAYPNHVFYAGFTIAVMSYLSVLFSPWLVFVLSIFVGFGVSWLGFYWISFFFSKDKFVSTTVALAAVTTPYIVTNIYGRGAWAEFLGCSFGIFLIGSLITLPKIEEGAIKLVGPSFVGAVFLVGTHNISLLLTSLFGFPIVLWVIISNRDLFWNVFFKRLTAATLGVLLVSPYLIPNLLYGADTLISSWNVLSTSAAFDSFKIIFSPFLVFPEVQQKIHEQIYGERTTVRLFAQTSLPLVLGSAFFFFATLRNSLKEVREFLMYLFNWCCFGLVLGLMTHNSWWQRFPKLFQTVQFPYRLHPYLLFFVVILFSTGSRIGKTPKKVAYAISVVCVLWSASIGVFQVITATQTTPPGFALASHRSIDSGLLPPVFRVNTAPPIQFQMKVVQPSSSIDNQMLYFGKFGALLPSYRVRFRATQDLPLEQAVPVVTIGSTGNATGFGVLRTPTGCQLIVDTWGQELEKITLKPCISTKFNYVLNISLSEAKYELEDGVGKVVTRGSLVAPDGLVGWGTNLIGMSTLTTNSTGKAIVHVDEIAAPDVVPGKYSTNVVHSPFVKVLGSSSVEPNSSGKLSAVINEKHPSWVLRVTWPLMLGFGLSLFSSLMIVLYLISVVRKHAL